MINKNMKIVLLHPSSCLLMQSIPVKNSIAPRMTCRAARQHINATARYSFAICLCLEMHAGNIGVLRDIADNKHRGCLPSLCANTH